MNSLWYPIDIRAFYVMDVSCPKSSSSDVWGSAPFSAGQDRPLTECIGFDSESSGPSELQISLVYNELRRLAASRLRAMSPGKSLHATALVHEAYLRLAKGALGPDASIWKDRKRFFAAAAEAMRQVIIDHYRRKHALKRGGDRARSYIEIDQLGEVPDSDRFMALNEALNQFQIEHPERATLVKLRYFGGMSLTECAEVLGISLATASRHWRYARAWLARYMIESS